MERLDKIIAGTGKYSRREVKELVRQGRVIVDGRLASSPEEKVDADAACLLVDGQSLDCRRYTYLMLHKPAGSCRHGWTDGSRRCWTCCRRSCANGIYPQWGGWIRTRRDCCC